MQEMLETRVRSLGQEDPLEEGMATHSSILAWGESHGQRSLVGYSSWGHKESDTTERLSTAQHIAAYIKMSVIACPCQDLVWSVS